MGVLSKFPLYLGLSVFLLSVLLSVAKVGGQRQIASLSTKAAEKKAALTLQAVDEHVSVLLLSESPVNGVDVTLTFDPSLLAVSAETLRGGPGFLTTVGDVSSIGTFSFSVVAQETALTSGILASFSVHQLKPNDGVPLQFLKEKSAAFEAGTGNNILVQTNGVLIKKGNRQ